MFVYDLQYEKEKVGTAAVEICGLYLQFTCRCRFAQKGIYKISVTGPAGTVNLGTCVPQGSGFVLERKIPQKSLGTGDLTFRITGPQAHVAATVVPVYTDKPFPYITKLRSAYLVCTGDTVGIRLNTDQPL